MTGSWREATPCFIHILINIRENESLILKIWLSSFIESTMFQNYISKSLNCKLRSHTKDKHGGTRLACIGNFLQTTPCALSRSSLKKNT